MENIFQEKSVYVLPENKYKSAVMYTCSHVERIAW